MSNQETREERNARQRRDRNALVVESIQVVKQVDAETHQHLTPDVPVAPPFAESPKGLLPTIRRVFARVIGFKK